jgi:exodeoxyribonuclease V beta subunit
VSDAPFDVCGPLPSGVTVLEASAGTGKTYTIAALTARYVAEGTPLDRMLLVTFTRMATGELRDRVRERLVAVERGLSRALAGARGDVHDEIVHLLAQGSPGEVRARRDNLSRALADFDAATIATTHGFCQEVLGGLGIAGDIAADTVFVEDLSDLLDEVVDDLYVRRFHARDTPDFTRAQAMRVALMATNNPQARIEPEGAPDDSVAAMRVRLAHAVRKELEARKHATGVMTYDDLLTRLHEALTGQGGDAVAARLRRRFAVVLVDEFQDTDPVQWEIMARAFGGDGGTLVLIGDPKQAIYAFRGADVYAYIDARATASRHETLAVNWRSDQGLIDAYDALFRGARLGHEGIVYRTVRAAHANQAPRLSGAPVAAPLRVRVARRDEPAIGRTPGGYARKQPAREHIAADLANDLVALLESAAEVEIRDDSGATIRRERVRPGHVAVLVRTHRNAAQVRDALDGAGIPAVVSGAGSVFGTPIAAEWLRLLDAVERPTSMLRARSAALTCFIGWSAERVALAHDDDWEDVHRRLHEWGRVLRDRGVASLTERLTLTEGLPGRVLARADGERRMTDLRHVAQLLHGAASAEQLGTAALVSWLRRRIAEADRDTADEERSRRLESDAAAVQILTIHRSKGLEFPIVYCPYLWEDVPLARDPEPIFFHEPVHGDLRTIDVGLDGPDWRRHLMQHQAEQRGEDLRLAYVALTRARHQAVVWWAGSFDSRHSALSRLVFARRDDEDVPPLGRFVPSDDDALARLRELAAAAPGCVSVELAQTGAPRRWSSAPPPPADLAVATFDRTIDWRWRRTSYSDITAAAHEPLVASEPEEGLVSDEHAPAASTLPPRPAPPAAGAAPAAPAPAAAAPTPAAAAPTPAAAAPTPAAAAAPTSVADLPSPSALAREEAAVAALKAVPSPLAAMPAGVHVGTFVHQLLQDTDFAAPDLGAELRRHMAAARRRVDVGDPAAVVAGLRAALETPLGPLLAGRRLCDVARADRLDELRFELPLAGGDQPRGRGVELEAIGALLREHLPTGDPLAGYATRLADPALRRETRGYLTGSIDLVLRDGERFAIVDYKTNWLAGPGEELSAWHHRPAALVAEMERYHYGLQALLYTVALHRYLRWRVAGYDPERHLAGVLYLFLRGMSGAQTPVVDGSPCGVFAWKPPPRLVAQLSDILDRGSAA